MSRNSAEPDTPFAAARGRPHVAGTASCPALAVGADASRTAALAAADPAGVSLRREKAERLREAQDAQVTA